MVKETKFVRVCPDCGKDPKQDCAKCAGTGAAITDYGRDFLEFLSMTPYALPLSDEFQKDLVEESARRTLQLLVEGGFVVEKKKPLVVLAPPGSKVK